MLETEGKPCHDNYSCVNSLTCANKICVEYSSVEDFAPSDNELACKSGFTFADKCLPTPLLTSDQAAPDFRCTDSSD